MKMESLLVHSDGECAVILVIYADHSSLGERRRREREGRGRDGGSQSEKHVTVLFQWLIPYTLSLVPTSSI